MSRIALNLLLIVQACGAGPTPEALSLLQISAERTGRAEQVTTGLQALSDLVKQVADVLRASGMDSADVESQLRNMVRDAKSVEEGYGHMADLGKLPWEGTGRTPSHQRPSKQRASLPPLAFVRTHKTGDGSVAGILRRIGDSRNLSFLLPARGQDLGWLTAFPGSVTGRHTAPEKQAHDILCDHAVYDDAAMREYLGPSPLFFTLLRDPVAQLGSTFDERIDSAERFYRQSIHANWTLRINWLNNLQKYPDDAKKLLSPVDRAQFFNPQAHDLGWYRYAQGGTVDDRNVSLIDEWLSDLHRNLSFVLLNEYRDEGLVLLSRRLGIPVHELAYLDAPSRDATAVAPSAQEQQALNSIFAVDFRLYRLFNGTFWKQWTEAGGYEEFDRDLQELRLWNQVLQTACAEGNRRLCPRSSEDSGDADWDPRWKAADAAVL